MTRSFHRIACAGDTLAATLDAGAGATALLIVSGGNEIRSGAHAGMAQLAMRIAEQDFPVMRYDRRGIGESSGRNAGFLGSAEEITAAAAFLRQELRVRKIIAFGNCDAASALAFFGQQAGIDGYVLANPWVIETASDPDPERPAISSAAIRSRYWDRIRNPRTIVDLFTGRIDFRKLLTGMKQAVRSEENSPLAIRLRDALAGLDADADILLAKRDTTARAFLSAWNSGDFEAARRHHSITVKSLDSASHSFADENAKKWLTDRILERLRSA